MSKQSKLYSKHIAIVVAFSLFLFGCMQKMPANLSFMSSEPTVKIDESTIKIVNHVFKKSFIGGDWYYQGAKEQRGEIYAYIQIPAKLDMDKATQQDYIKKAICPSSQHNEMWQKLENVTLSVHIYTHNRRYTTYADCENPATV